MLEVDSSFNWCFVWCRMTYFGVQHEVAGLYFYLFFGISYSPAKYIIQMFNLSRVCRFFLKFICISKAMGAILNLIYEVKWLVWWWNCCMWPFSPAWFIASSVWLSFSVCLSSVLRSFAVTVFLRTMIGPIYHCRLLPSYCPFLCLLNKESVGQLWNYYCSCPAHSFSPIWLHMSHFSITVIKRNWVTGVDSHPICDFTTFTSPLLSVISDLLLHSLNLIQ